MECHVYYDPDYHSITATEGPPNWIGPRMILVGAFDFDKMHEPDTQSLRAWAVPRLQLLELCRNKAFSSLLVSNYATHAYWKFPYS